MIGGQQEATEVALKFLIRQSRFVQEVRAHLVGKGYDQASVENVVQFLIERKLVNDEKTTQNLIERNAGKRAVGIDKLKAELERLGAPAETVEANLAAIQQSEPERALGALRAKYKEGADRAKAGRFLYGRGFSEDATEVALDTFCGSSSFPD